MRHMRAQIPREEEGTEAFRRLEQELRRREEQGAVRVLFVSDTKKAVFFSCEEDTAPGLKRSLRQQFSQVDVRYGTATKSGRGAQAQARRQKGPER